MIPVVTVPGGRCVGEHGGRGFDVIVLLIGLLQFGGVVGVSRLTVTQTDTDTHGDATAAHEVARDIDDDNDH